MILHVTEAATRRHLGELRLVDGKVLADPPRLAVLLDRHRRPGVSDADAMEALRGWSNGYLVVHDPVE